MVTLRRATQVFAVVQLTLIAAFLVYATTSNVGLLTHRRASATNCAVIRHTEMNIDVNVGSTRRERYENITAPEVSTNGQWQPSTCIARHRLALIIPFRYRDKHLEMLLNVLHPMLQRQMLDYSSFVVEQIYPDIFNKAMLMNAGYSEVKKLGRFDCVIFHDVDLHPVDDRNMYTCSPTPRHVAGFINKWGYRLFYQRMFGGAVAFRQRHFELVNGYSNTFFGWGGEDDDMFKRTRAKQLKLNERHPRCVAKYNMMAHKRDKNNPSLHLGYLGWQYRPANYRMNGLNSLNYTLDSVEVNQRYVKLKIRLPPTPEHIIARLNRGKRAATTTSASWSHNATPSSP